MTTKEEFSDGKGVRGGKIYNQSDVYKIFNICHEHVEIVNKGIYSNLQDEINHINLTLRNIKDVLS